MYRFIKFKKIKSKKTNEVSRFDIYIREKRNKWDNKTKDKYINRNKNIIFEGLEGAGKSRELEKLKNYNIKIWRQKKVFFIKGIEPFSEWFHKNITEQEIEEFTKENNLTKKELNKSFTKLEIMIKNFKNGVLIIDDIDKIVGRKMEILKEFLKIDIIIVCTCKDFNELNKTIQILLKKREYEIISLNTKASYDATYMLFVVFIVMIAALGQPELAVMVMMGRYMLKGVQK
jgi:alpha-N-acetylglucosamine transferase